MDAATPSGGPPWLGAPGFSSTPLLQLKANKRNPRGETPLHLAAKRNDAPRIQALIRDGAQVNITDYAGTRSRFI